MRPPSLFDSPPPELGSVLYRALREARSKVEGKVEPMLRTDWADLPEDDQALFSAGASAALRAVPAFAGEDACRAWAAAAERTNPWDDLPELLRGCWRAGASAVRLAAGVTP